jgi:hypothetical protein
LGLTQPRRRGVPNFAPGEPSEVPTWGPASCPRSEAAPLSAGLALFFEALRHQQLVPDSTRPRPPRTLAPRQPHRGELVLLQPLLVAHEHQGPLYRRTRAAQLGVLAQEPSGVRLPRKHAHGLLVVGEGRPPSRRRGSWGRTSTSWSSFPKGHSYVCTGCYESKTATGAGCSSGLLMHPSAWKVSHVTRIPSALRSLVALISLYLRLAPATITSCNNTSSASPFEDSPRNLAHRSRSKLHC